MREKLGGRRLRFSDAERALLARKVKAVGRKTLMELDPIVSPDTLLRWASTIGRAKVELCAPPRSGATEDNARDLGVDRPDGA